MDMAQGREADRYVRCYLIHYHAPDWCRSAIASLQASEGLTVDVTVVDNGGWDGPVPDGVGFLRQEVNRGFTAGANAALQDWWGRGEPRVIIGAHDLHVEPWALQRLLEGSEKAPGYGILAPTMRDTAVGPVVDDAAPEGIVPRSWVAGACMMLTRQMISDIGGFDEVYASYLEDRDLCHRARDAGWDVGVVSAAAGWGLGKASKRAYVMQFTNQVVFAARHRGAWAALKAWAWLLIACVLEGSGSLSPKRAPDERARLRRRSLDRVRAFLRVPGGLLFLLRSRGSTIPRFMA